MLRTSSFLDTEITFLKGVGPERARTLTNELNIRTFLDLLTHFPFRYIDRTKFYSIKEVNGEMPFVQFKAKIISAEIVGAKKGKRLVALVSDGTGSMELVWFKGIKWVAPKLQLDAEFILFGKPSIFNGKMNIAHPDIDIASEENIVIAKKLQPVYHTGEKLKSSWLDSKGIWKLERTLVAQINKNIPETLSQEIIKKYNLISREEAFKIIHTPDNNEVLQKAIYRLKFDELFFLQLRLLQIKGVRKKTYSGLVFDKVGNYFNDFYANHLPFPLTNAQKRVLREIRTDMGTGKQMNRLLQGDVGSGKTIVALMSMLIALDNGFQAGIMAPTEILANQHFKNVSKLLEKTNIRVGLLTGSTKLKERTFIHEQLQKGELNILIGTHALIEDEVKFSNLGLVVIDEQHKFGVAQRSKLWKKGMSVPHVLVMTATPIPRTLAMTLYGDLDVSVIDELPPGRTPVKTVWRSYAKHPQVFQFIKEEIKKGRQVYVVYPIIEESKTLDYKNLEEGYELIKKEFGPPQPLPKGGALESYEMADPTVYPLLKEFVKHHRSNSTDAESVLWNELQTKQFEGYKFRRQHIIGSYITDFICLKKRLIIEVDGLIHQLPDNKESDLQRTQWLEQKGFKVIRFTNDEVIHEIAKVLSQIKSVIELQPEIEAAPSSLPSGGQGWAIGMVHGRMKPKLKEEQMKRFAAGETNILVATTVIEVGVDIPNASLMVIESAERFGLSQLHQLRGRVGRGADESYCILMTGYELSGDGRTRMETMVRTTNGFEIAETDLRLRGPGDMSGTQQSGMLDFKIADISRDAQLLQYTRGIAEELLQNDPELMNPENAAILFELNRIKKEKPYWGRIS